MTDDELEHILGPELYAELSQQTEGMDLLPYQTEKHDHERRDYERFDKIAERFYNFSFPIDGESLLELMAALHHSGYDACPNCTTYIVTFTTVLLTQMWDTVLSDLEQEEGEQ